MWVLNPESGVHAERQSAVLAIMQMSRALERVDAGLSPQQYRILKLAGAGGERSARLAQRLAVAKPTLTAIADSLVAAGLARREAEAGDRRVVRLHLTAAGTAAVQRADAAYEEWLSRLLELTGAGGRVEADLLLLSGALDELRGPCPAPVTEPPVTEPPVTEPPVTEPAVSEPAVTVPAVTVPAVTEAAAPSVVGRS